MAMKSSCGLLIFLLPCFMIAADYEIGGIQLKRGPSDNCLVKSQEWSWLSGSEKMPVKAFEMNSGRMIYTIRHDLKHGNGTIGLSTPTNCNWYESGMLNILLNGTRFDFKPENNEKICVSDGEAGIVEMSWEDDRANVTCAFVLRHGDSKLYLDVRLSPKVALKTVEVRLTNYPSGFNKTPRHVLVTAERVLAEAAVSELIPDKERWVFYSDAALDCANNPSAQGPSALALGGEGLIKARLRTGGYGVSTTLEYAPSTRRMVYCLWEFPRTTNADALTELRSSVDDAIQRMAATTLTPPSHAEEAK